MTDDTDELDVAVLNTVAQLKVELDKCTGSYQVRVHPMVGGWWIEVTKNTEACNND